MATAKKTPATKTAKKAAKKTATKAAKKTATKAAKKLSKTSNKGNPCWPGFEPVPGKKPMTKGSCKAAD